MPRERITARLAIVDEQIGLTRAGIDTQRLIVEEMRLKRYAAAGAETNLTILAANLAVHLAERERLIAELASLPPP